MAFIALVEQQAKGRRNAFLLGIQHAFHQRTLRAVVGQQVVLFRNRIDAACVTVAGNSVQRREPGAQQGRRGAGIVLQFAAAGEDDVDLPGIGPQYGSKAQFRLCTRVPTLTGLEKLHRRIVLTLPAIRKKKPAMQGFSEGFGTGGGVIRRSGGCLASIFLYFGIDSKAG